MKDRTFAAALSVQRLFMKLLWKTKHFLALPIKRSSKLYFLITVSESTILFSLLA